MSAAQTCQQTGFCKAVPPVNGGGVTGGAYGADLTEADLMASHPPFAVDFRAVFSEILQRHLQADPTVVFTEPFQSETLGFIA